MKDGRYEEGEEEEGEELVATVRGGRSIKMSFPEMAKVHTSFTQVEVQILVFKKYSGKSRSTY